MAAHPGEALAHQVYLERRDWRTALGLWNACEAVGNRSVESRLAITHCRIELAEPDALPAITVGDVPPVALGWVEAYVHLLRVRAFHHLCDNEPVRASQITRLLGVVDPQLGRVYREAIGSSAIGPQPAIPGDTHDDLLPFERELRLDDATTQRLLEGLRARRVLMVHRGAFDPAPGVINEALYRQYTTSLRAVGVEPMLLNPFVMPDMAPESFPDRLRAALLAYRPDIVFYDDLLVAGFSADPGMQPVILDMLEAARRDWGTRIVATYPDSWYDGMERLIGSARDVIDLFHVFHPGLLERVAPDLRAKIYCYPHPVTDVPGTASPPERMPRACFIGGINWANMPRLVWWTEIARAGLPIDLYPTVSGQERTPAQYADLMRRYAIGISFTSRSNHRRVLTSRTMEGPLFGTLIVEENAEDTAYFLRPYEHFVPFSSLVDLATQLQRLLTDPALCAALAQRGSAWVRRHFTGDHFWARLYHRLYVDPAPPSDRPRRPYVPVEIEIPTSSLALVKLLKPGEG